MMQMFKIDTFIIAGTKLQVCRKIGKSFKIELFSIKKEEVKLN
jgi:hypothetical protein